MLWPALKCDRVKPSQLKPSRRDNTPTFLSKLTESSFPRPLVFGRPPDSLNGKRTPFKHQSGKFLLLAVNNGKSARNPSPLQANWIVFLVTRLPHFFNPILLSTSFAKSGSILSVDESFHRSLLRKIGLRQDGATRCCNEPTLRWNGNETGSATGRNADENPHRGGDF